MKAFFNLGLFVLVATMVVGCKAAHKGAKVGKKPKVTEQVAAKVEGLVTCSLKAEKRVLEVKNADGGCEVMYTKGGEAKSVASSRHGNEHCKKTVENIKGKLVAAGWSCQ